MNWIVFPQGLHTFTWGKIPWRREWQPTPVFLPGEFHGQRSLAGYSPWDRRVEYDWATNFYFFQDLYAEVLTPDVTVVRDDTFKEVIKVKWGGKVDPNPTGFADLRERKLSPSLFLLLPLSLFLSLPPQPQKMLCEDTARRWHLIAKERAHRRSQYHWHPWNSEKIDVEKSKS